jgi:hypothetical protein
MRCSPVPSTGMKPIWRGSAGFEMSNTAMPADQLRVVGVAWSSWRPALGL